MTANIMNAKMALAIQYNDFLRGNKDSTFDGTTPTTLPISSSFWDLPIYLLDRAECESDPRFLQLIPYNVLTLGGKIFHYSRGKGGAEARLHAKNSIGVGGHIDSAPPFMLKNLLPPPPEKPMHLAAWCAMEASREIEEEVGLVVDPYLIKFQSLLLDRTSDVNAVHIGLLSQVALDDIDGSDELKLEENVITSGTFLSPESIDVSKLETWSQLAIYSLYPTIA